MEARTGHFLIYEVRGENILMGVRSSAVIRMLFLIHKIRFSYGTLRRGQVKQTERKLESNSVPIFLLSRLPDFTVCNCSSSKV